MLDFKINIVRRVTGYKFPIQKLNSNIIKAI
jgi:hypothetical protein